MSNLLYFLVLKSFFFSMGMSLIHLNYIKMLKKMLWWIMFGIWFISIIWLTVLILNAGWKNTKNTATDIKNVTENQKLTASEWNNMVNYIKNKRGKNWKKLYYTVWNVWIWTSNPTTKLHVNWNIIASTPTQNNHVATKQYVDNKDKSLSITTLNCKPQCIIFC